MSTAHVIESKIVEIDVTAQDILSGTRLDSPRCPIALALRRSVGQFDWLLNPSDCPPWVLDWVRDFDAGRAVQPIRFEVRVRKMPGTPWDRRSL